MSSEKPSWVKTNVGWDIRKVIWQRLAMGDTIAEIKTFFDLHQDEYKNAPIDRNTIAAVRNELADLPLELLDKLLEEMPEIETFLKEKRPDFKEKIESSKRPHSHPSSSTYTVVPKRKIQSQTGEITIFDSKFDGTHRTKL